MKPLVIYYSHSGNNKYLAQKIADSLKCDIEQIRPRLNIFPFQILFSITKTSLGIKKCKYNLGDYDRIVLIGPIWMGQVISPLRTFINFNKNSIKKLYFATCSGSDESSKNDKFGYMSVFRQIEDILGKKCVHCEAFPIGLALPVEKQKDSDAIMKTRLSEKNFSGALEKQLNEFVKKVLDS